MSTLKDQPSAAPTRKVTAGGIGGAIVGLISWLLLRYGIEIDPATADALTVVLTWVGGVVSAYMTRERA